MKTTGDSKHSIPVPMKKLIMISRLIYPEAEYKGGLRHEGDCWCIRTEILVDKVYLNINIIKI